MSKTFLIIARMPTDSKLASLYTILVFKRSCTVKNKTKQNVLFVNQINFCYFSEKFQIREQKCVLYSNSFKLHLGRMFVQPVHPFLYTSVDPFRNIIVSVLCSLPIVWPC